MRQYGRWTFIYVLGVLLLWVLGIEGIWEHPTPFYGMLKPAFTSAFVPAAAVSLFWLAWLLVRAAALGRTHSLGRTALAFLPWAIFTGVVAMLFVAVAPRLAERGQTPASILAEFGWNLPAFVVFLSGLGALAFTLHKLRWFDEEPDSRATKGMLIALVLFAFFFSAAIASLRGGPQGISHAYSRFDLEYIGDIGFGGSIRGLFQDYLPRHEFLTMHSKVHPPGPVVLLWIMSYALELLVGPGAGGAKGLSLATMAVGSLAVLPLYGWVKDMLGRRAALTACVLYVLMPSVVLFTATSADILFMPFTLLTLFLFGRALERGSIAYAFGAGLGYAAMSLLSFSLLSVGAWFGFIGLWRLLERRNWFPVLQTAVVMIAAFLAVHLLVGMWGRFDIIAVFLKSKAQFDADQRALDLYAPRWPWWAWKLLNPLAWLYFAGIPVSVLFFRRLVRPEADTRILFIIFALTLLVLDVLYLARGEGERSALYVFPFVLVPAAHALHRIGEDARSHAPLLATAAFLAFQCWLTESYLYTYW
jgi:MFS family permease